METIQGINQTRVLWCCDDRGITPQELAASVGIPDIKLEKMLNGENSLTFNQLRSIAQFFNRGVLFFLEPGPVDGEQVYTPQFRTITNQLPTLDPKIKVLIERVEKQREVYLSLREDLGEADQGLFAPPALQPEDVKQAAKIIRQWLSLPDENKFESYRGSIEDHGILVFRSNGYNGPWQIAKTSPVCGFSLYHEKFPVIVIKKDASENRQVFTLMHELGHILLHKSSFMDEVGNLYSTQGQEREANAFAGYLLVPDTFLEQISDTGRPSEVSEYNDWLKPFQRKWGVSTEVILRRLLESHRLSSAQYGAYREWVGNLSITDTGNGSRMYRYREPQHIFGDPFVRTVLDALSARFITLAKASTYLDNLKIKDVHQLEHYIAGL